MDQTWRYSASHTPSAPTVKATISGLTVELLIDTGFAGGILIPFPIFQSVGLTSRVLPQPFFVVLPDARRVVAYTALAEVTIGDMGISTRIHSSPTIEKRLVGRETLKRIVARLDGPRETVTLSIGRQG